MHCGVIVTSATPKPASSCAAPIARRGNTRRYKPPKSKQRR